MLYVLIRHVQFQQPMFQFALGTDHVEGSYVVTFAEALFFLVFQQVGFQALEVVHVLVLALQLYGGTEGVRWDLKPIGI